MGCIQGERIDLCNARRGILITNGSVILFSVRWGPPGTGSVSFSEGRDFYLFSGSFNFFQANETANSRDYLIMRGGGLNLYELKRRLVSFIIRHPGCAEF